MNLLYWVLSIPKLTVLATIRFYQRLASPDHGPLRKLFPYGYCKYHPTCSMYAYQAVQRFGVTRGLLLGLWRICRCNPISKGGLDPVPERKVVKK